LKGKKKNEKTTGARQFGKRGAIYGMKDFSSSEGRSGGREGVKGMGAVLKRRRNQKSKMPGINGETGEKGGSGNSKSQKGFLDF